MGSRVCRNGILKTNLRVVHKDLKLPMSSSKPLILIVEDKPNHRQSLVDLLIPEGYRTVGAVDGLDAIEKLRRRSVNLVLLDLKLPRMDGMEVLRWLRQNHPKLPVIVISGYGDVPTAVSAIKLGAYDFLEKPLQAEQVLTVVRNALHQVRENGKQNRLAEDFQLQYQMVGRSKAMQEVFSLIRKAAQSNCKVLIVGENGTGKELVARAIHRTSPRARGRFVAINCAAIPQGLIESELFGYKKGAFTGAYADRPGKFLLAHKGTLFLDEIGSMELSMQVKLLRALEEEAITPVGGTNPIQVDTRVIAATNKDLAREMREGRFRKDLYYRLNVLTIYIPPLREHKEDIPPLVEHFLSSLGKGSLRRLDPEAMSLLLDYSWPGNIRELRNVVERLVVLADKEVIEKETIRRILESPGPFIKEERLPLKEARERFEREYIFKALAANKWSIKETARYLGINRSHLWKMMQRYGIEKSHGNKL